MAAIENHARRESFELEHFLPYRLSLLSNTVSQGIARFYQQKHQLSVPEWRVMAVLGRYPDSTASQVCERTVMDKVTVCRAVKLLLDKQYVERVTDASDRRKRPLKVSDPHGRSVMKEVIPFALDYQKAMLKNLSAAEWRLFDRLIDKLFAIATELNTEHIA